jgi:hypothetical protein
MTSALRIAASFRLKPSSAMQDPRRLGFKLMKSKSESITETQNQMSSRIRFSNSETASGQVEWCI